MATIANPLLALDVTVYAVRSGNSELARRPGATFFKATVQEITWNDFDNTYHYRLVGASQEFWIAEAKLNTAVVGEYFSTNQNNARAAFRALVDLTYP